MSWNSDDLSKLHKQDDSTVTCEYQSKIWVPDLSNKVSLEATVPSVSKMREWLVRKVDRLNVMVVTR